MTTPRGRSLQILAREQSPLAMPIASFPGAQLTGASVRQLTHEADAQTEAILALHERFRTDVLLTCMDLSVEAEAFGAELHPASDDEVPSVAGRRITSPAEAASLAAPEVGAARTALQVKVVQGLSRAAPGRLILAGVTGPFSLAARLLGVSEALVLTLQEPALVHQATERGTRFLAQYLKALKDSGAGGVFLAEPTSGLLSPKGLATFSTPYLRELIKAVEAPDFTLVVHNCAARAVHLPAIIQSGAAALHFGAPMDLGAALNQVSEGTLVAGNLDPTSVFQADSPDQVTAAVHQHLGRFSSRPNFLLSSGCDLPRQTPLVNLESFFDAARSAGRPQPPTAGPQASPEVDPGPAR